MSKQFKKNLLALAAFASLGVAAAPAYSAEDIVFNYATDNNAVVPYAIDGRNIVARSNTDLCWRTGYWTPAAAQSAFAGNNLPMGCSCDADLMPAEACQVTTQAAPAPTAEKVKLAADALFDFDKAVLRPEGRQQLDELAAKANQINLEVILATGHTDRIGSDSYNQSLSQRRAAAVKDYLVSRGLDAQRVYTEGKGESQPVTGTSCDNVSARNALIDCLQPDRRVEIEVIGTTN